MQRGLQRGLQRGSERGLQRGVQRGLQRGAHRVAHGARAREAVSLRSVPHACRADVADAGHARRHHHAAVALDALSLLLRVRSWIHGAAGSVRRAGGRVRRRGCAATAGAPRCCRACGHCSGHARPTWSHLVRVRVRVSVSVSVSVSVRVGATEPSSASYRSSRHGGTAARPWRSARRQSHGAACAAAAACSLACMPAHTAETTPAGPPRGLKADCREKASRDSREATTWLGLRLGSGLGLQRQPGGDRSAGWRSSSSYISLYLPVSPHISPHLCGLAQ